MKFLLTYLPYALNNIHVKLSGRNVFITPKSDKMLHCGLCSVESSAWIFKQLQWNQVWLYGMLPSGSNATPIAN